MTKRILTVGLMVLTVAMGSRAEDATPAKASVSHPRFEQMKKMVGTWVEADKDGKPTDTVVSIVKLTAGGSAIHETLFPGQPMEMLSIYHLDKGDVVMTHYCMLGNQPRMKLDPKSTAKQLHWVFDGGTNFDPAKDTHMHSATTTIIDEDHIETTGEAWVNGKPSPDHCGCMKLVRKK